MGTTRAEKKSLERFPIEMTPLGYKELIDSFGGKTEVDFNALPRSYYQLGYEQAEKDTIVRVARWMKKNHLRYPNDAISTSVLIANFKEEIK